MRRRERRTRREREWDGRGKKCRWRSACLREITRWFYFDIATRRKKEGTRLGYVHRLSFLCFFFGRLTTKLCFSSLCARSSCCSLSLWKFSPNHSTWMMHVHAAEWESHHHQTCICIQKKTLRHQHWDRRSRCSKRRSGMPSFSSLTVMDRIEEKNHG